MSLILFFILFQKGIVEADDLTFAIFFRSSWNSLHFLMHRFTLEEHAENLQVLTSQLTLY